MMSDQIKPTWVIFTLVPSPGCSAHSLIIQKKKALLLELFFSILSLSCLSLLLQGPVWVRPLVQLTRLPPTIWFSIHLRTTQRRHTLYTTADLQQREHKKNCKPKGKKSSTYGFIFVSFSSHVRNVFDQNVFCKMCFTSKERNVKKAKQRSMCSLTQIEEVVFF